KVNLTLTKVQATRKMDTMGEERAGKITSVDRKHEQRTNAAASGHTDSAVAARWKTPLACSEERPNATAVSVIVLDTQKPALARTRILSYWFHRCKGRTKDAAV